MKLKDIKQLDSWPALVPGFAGLLLGGGLAFVLIAGHAEEYARASWSRTAGVLHEVGIEHNPFDGTRGSSMRYRMKVHYSYEVGGRRLEGTAIDPRHSSSTSPRSCSSSRTTYPRRRPSRPTTSPWGATSDSGAGSFPRGKAEAASP